ncbi:CHAD domain-containing protein [Onishia taeanensis]|uniref:CHAD domain-containing protein n=1 Tax=Onishia taeanensis TaxID=284577 RepID=A0A328XYX7_9GAMM|nr:CHAD domain-containing protein [Halomonas taeanensis]RAR64719.1 CHAD domain-containing protein [Halomonas taeanensis]
MAFALRLDRAMQANLTRIVDRQLRKALAELAVEPSDPRLADHVHQVRKRMKMLRGLLRLMRYAMPPDMYRRENAALRDAANALSGSRDAQVCIDTFDILVPAETLEDEARQLAPVREALVAARDRLLAGAEAEENGRGDNTAHHLASARTQLEAVRERLPSWRLTEKGVKAIAGGLKKVYGQGRAAFTQAYSSGDDGDFHEWRKQVKYHWYHVRLLHPLWPAAQRARARELKLLAERLGDEHDLTMLREELLRLEGLEDGIVAELEWRASRRQLTLRDDARRLGGLLYAESPKAFCRRYRRFWKVARP